MLEKYLTAQQVSQILGCSLSFVYEHKDELGAVVIGTLIRFPASRFEVSNGNVETREQMAVQVSMAGPADQVREGVRNSGRSTRRRSRKEDRVEPDRDDPHGLRKALRKSLEYTAPEKGQIILL